MKMIQINIAGKASLLKEESAQQLANQLALKGIYADITEAHYGAYDTEIVALKTHLNDMRKLVGAIHGITL